MGLRRTRKSSFDYESYLQELIALAEAAGGQVVAQLIQARERPDAATYIGKGKVQELIHLCEEMEPHLILFDGELSPGQVRQLEERLSKPIMDRTMLILDIFARRAQSLEGKLQVELATLEYRLPRLTGQGQVLSRTGGGIGTRGLGEQQLELDRRHIRRRIRDIRRQMARVEKTRQLHRKQRIRQGLKTISLVGYTNVGKSTLFNAICQKFHTSGKEQVRADDRLFQTLDTTTRKITLPNGQEVLVTDTVGFIQDLPPHLIAAFRSTLEEAVEADLILHVVDISDPAYMEKIAVVDAVLEDLGAQPGQVYRVFNKMDQLSDPEYAAGTVPRISALSSQGVSELLAYLGEALQSGSKPERPVL